MTSPPQAQAPRQPEGRNEWPRKPEERRADRVFFVTGELLDESTGHSVVRLARELRRRGKEVGFACGGGPLVEELERIGISPLVSPRLAAGGGRWRLPAKLTHAVRDFQPELIHAFGRPLADWARKLSQSTELPYVLTVMTFAPSEREGRVRGDWTRGAAVAVSQELREQLVNQARIPKNAVAVVPFGIALEDYERYCETAGPGHTPVVGMVGPLTPDRGCDYFLQAARQILDAGHDAQFLIAGQGPDRGRLRRLTRKLNIERWVTLVHHFTDYRRMIAVLDVCVLPALHEGFSLNVVEAMACRKPVVATGVGAVYDIVEDGETGLLAPKKDPVAIAERVIQLLEDRELAAQIVEAAYERVRERFSLAASVRQMLDLYARLLARTGSAEPG